MGSIDLQKINTEAQNGLTHHLETKTTPEILTLINNEDQKIAKAIAKEIPTITKATDLCYETLKNQGRIFYIGAGSSGRIGVLDASEMLPTYGVKDAFCGIIAGGDLALRLPIEGAEDDFEQAKVDLKAHNFQPNDLVFAIGASGRTPYCLGALDYGHQIGAKTISLAMTSEPEFKAVSDLSIAIISGPEVVTGSTRMKAGTATKMVLNMISTTTMIKMGKVYDNLMVEVQATNKKLEERCFQIVKKITQATDEIVMTALQDSQMNAKVACLMILGNHSAEKAQELLIINPLLGDYLN
ncbi:N-acetylmuramic acid 6-phosphate etherase [Entomoplasma freundtii]|uniref:N-acetylmuramic acid 6-phosphate etherase n=1 Tax=Entomoplasma freundtii TaxID=74700 RepID=A0A2K8NUJ0_9MOLU|nr:N-acetylmuramic acid 6-phosphate etherase [Entomoplasma freundtii]ATZ16293.1 N-acetylmuramic acid 6-phosphate etherase [Entomoplasma freundtii]TDY56805.1 N-acetylmuramic acid 6-phosphate etherase [Entomoplasma freundtii]